MESVLSEEVFRLAFLNWLKRLPDTLLGVVKHQDALYDFVVGVQTGQDPSDEVSATTTDTTEQNDQVTSESS